MGVLTPPPLLESKEFNMANPMPSDALAQIPSACRKVEASSQDNLGAVAGNSAGPPDMFVLPPFTPPGAKASVGALVKCTSTVLMKRVETQMETDEQFSSTSIGRTHVPSPTPAKPKDYVAPSLADEAGMKKWSNDMLSGHPGGCATSFEQ